jgi:hypothetical protein
MLVPSIRPVLFQNGRRQKFGLVCIHHRDWLLQKGHGVDETTPAVERQQEDAVQALLCRYFFNLARRPADNGLGGRSPRDGVRNKSAVGIERAAASLSKTTTVGFSSPRSKLLT